MPSERRKADSKAARGSPYGRSTSKTLSKSGSIRNLVSSFIWGAPKHEDADQDGEEPAEAEPAPVAEIPQQRQLRSTRARTQREAQLQPQTPAPKPAATPKAPAAEVNSLLSNFFAEKGSQDLTLDERKRVSNLLLGPSTSVPTLFTPRLSESTTVKATPVKNSILSPSFNGPRRSESFSFSLSDYAAQPTPPTAGPSTGLRTSHSLGSLSSLVATADTSANKANRKPTSRQLYLGPGYSSTAIARRRRAQAAASTTGNIYSSLDTFGQTAGESTLSRSTTMPDMTTPALSETAKGKRRKVDDEVEPPAQIPETPKKAPEALTIPVQKDQPTLSKIVSIPPHLRSAATPVRPSPLRHAFAPPTPSPPTTPASETRASTSIFSQKSSRTADIMADIIRETKAKQPKINVEEAVNPYAVDQAPVPAGKLDTTKPSRKANLVSREALSREAKKGTATSILEQSIPAEIRAALNKDANVKPPPVNLPSARRKLRSSTMAERAKSPPPVSTTPAGTPSKANGIMSEIPSKDFHSPVPSFQKSSAPSPSPTIEKTLSSTTPKQPPPPNLDQLNQKPPPPPFFGTKKEEPKKAKSPEPQQPPKAFSGFTFTKPSTSSPNLFGTKTAPKTTDPTPEPKKATPPTKVDNPFSLPVKTVSQPSNPFSQSQTNANPFSQPQTNGTPAKPVPTFNFTSASPAPTKPTPISTPQEAAKKLAESSLPRYDLLPPQPMVNGITYDESARKARDIDVDQLPKYTLLV